MTFKRDRAMKTTMGTTVLPALEFVKDVIILKDVCQA